MKRCGLAIAVVFVVAWSVGGCYGKDNGPKHPRASGQFDTTVSKFLVRMKQCMPQAVQTNMHRPMTAAELANKQLTGKALSNFKIELSQCLTGKGYGNEIQLEGAKVDAWLAAPDCAGFAKALFDTPECSALQMVFEDSGFSEQTTGPAAIPAAGTGAAAKPAAARPAGAAPAGVESRPAAAPGTAAPGTSPAAGRPAGGSGHTPKGE
ncbi:MAG: hypothetical protein J7M25_00830 [Deltaproteobacteria bacterium]|nr:hypothetical protein [Deltaproteobacteria bacterium]